MGDEGVVIQLGGPRRLRLTVDAAARFEEELGVSFDQAFNLGKGETFESWVSRVLYPFLIDEEPGLTLEAVRKIVDKHLAPLPMFSKIRRCQEIRKAVLKAGKAFEDSLESGKFMED